MSHLGRAVTTGNLPTPSISQVSLSEVRVKILRSPSFNLFLFSSISRTSSLIKSSKTFKAPPGSTQQWTNAVSILFCGMSICTDKVSYSYGLAPCARIYKITSTLKSIKYFVDIKKFWYGRVVGNQNQVYRHFIFSQSNEKENMKHSNNTFSNNPCTSFVIHRRMNNFHEPNKNFTRRINLSLANNLTLSQLFWNPFTFNKLYFIKYKICKN